MATWREIVTAELRKVPKDATPRERGEAMKRASRIYRGQGETRENPNLLTVAAIAAGGYLVYEHLIKPAMASQAATTHQLGQ